MQNHFPVYLSLLLSPQSLSTHQDRNIVCWTFSEYALTFMSLLMKNFSAEDAECYQGVH